MLIMLFLARDKFPLITYVTIHCVYLLHHKPLVKRQQQQQQQQHNLTLHICIYNIGFVLAIFKYALDRRKLYSKLLQFIYTYSNYM